MKKSNTILEISNLSKQYRLGVVGTGTLKHDFKRWWHKLIGKEDPFILVGEENDRSTKGNSDYIWALKDVNLTINKGDVVGIIGKNGAGKSTLLKILSKVTGPTTGVIKTKGRIASLLEVGTGFHGEMTGRENIFLNGAILGMTKKEISSKIEEIIEFSGCQRYIDTPVKRYSSGMTVRLAFAVAAFLEPEILVIDEVLAVGDAEFQKKAIGKMQDIAKGEGRTVLFVSHNMAAVKNLCTRGVVLENGLVKYDGNVDDALTEYSNINKNTNYKIDLTNWTERTGNGAVKFDYVELHNKKKEPTLEYFIGDDLNITFGIENFSKEKNCDFAVQIKTSEEMPIYHIMARDSDYSVDLNEVKQNYTVSIKDLRLYPGLYSITLIIANKTGHQIFDNIDNAIVFEVSSGGDLTSRYLPKSVGLLFLNPDWKQN